MRWLDYPRAWRVLKVGLAAAPLAPLVSPIVGAPLRAPTATSARAAVALTIGLTGLFLFRAASRSPREALFLLAATVGASSAAAHLVAARANAFFLADLLYEIAAVLLLASAVSAGLRVGRIRRFWSKRATVATRRELSDTVTRASALFLLLFWVMVTAAQHYLAAIVLFVLAGTVAATLMLRMTEGFTAEIEPGGNDHGPGAKGHGPRGG
ncbi:MAG TPA: hypothetical protein VFU01_13565 [Gemmatimonadaceae bacterium]|nr:hypothetical protein [Gemmatimonadaceae bacterium]